ncbi:alpha/beta fold hydrolase [Pendulispora rubella]|uniref:Alpha/beta fold hydrolase n=1 Tax=Pendulispora rubella TaxID=2741070 RepID=A0ABZ2LIC4_9BACT
MHPAQRPASRRPERRVTAVGRITSDVGGPAQDGDDKWMMTLKKASTPLRIRLFCFPYAGGSPELFRPWADGLDEGVELVAVRLPGRGRRLREAPYSNWKALLDDTFAALAPYLSEPHAFYGHSFGGRLAYELVHRTTKVPGAQTRGLFVSGCRSPDTPQARPYMHEMSEDGFLDAVRGMGGTPSEILDNKIMKRLFLPVMHAEIRLAELWDDRHGTGVDVPVTAMYGREDHIDGRANMSGWQAFSLRACELLEMPGGHFFLETHRQQLLEVIHARLGAPNR